MFQRVSLLLVTFIATQACWQTAAPHLKWEGNSVLAAAPAKQVQLTLKIADEDSGLEVQAKRSVSSGITALEALQATVPVKTKNYPGLGVRVLGICNVEPVRGKYWGLFVDGKYAEAGIADIKIEKDTVIEWKTQK